jgi:hypothetical protein
MAESRTKSANEVEEIVAQWNAAESGIAFARARGISATSAYAMTSRLRKLGHPLKHFPRGRHKKLESQEVEHGEF